MSRSFDPRAWVVWLAAGMVLVMTLRNPLYLILLLGVARAVQRACGQPGSVGRALPFRRIAVFILLFSTLFNMLSAHIGQTVLARLPAHWWLVGGDLTLEAALFGFINGLSLVTLLAFFVALNAVVPVHELAGLVPSALHELGIVILLALTYLPETARQYQRIREAQAIRGHRIQGLRDWRPIIIPLVIGGLERAMNLAESMVARGFASTGERALPGRMRVVLIGGLSLGLLGVTRVALGGSDGWLLLVVGGACVLLVYLALRRNSTRTRYRPHQWNRADTVMVAAAVSAVAAVLALRWAGADVALGYSPYPVVTMPGFSLWVVGAILLLATPAAIESRQ